MYIKNFADSLSSNSKNTYFCLLLLISLSFSHSITLQTISNKSKFPSPWSWIFRNTHAHAFSNVCRHQRIVIIFVCFILYVGHVLMKYSNVLNYVFMPFPLFYCSAIQSPSKSFTLKKTQKSNCKCVQCLLMYVCGCVGAWASIPLLKIDQICVWKQKTGACKVIPLLFFLDFDGREKGWKWEMDSDEGNKATMTATKAEAIKHTRGHKNK